MIKKLRRKVVAILMSMVTLILLGVFLSMLFSSWSASKRMSEDFLHQAIRTSYAPPGEKPPQANFAPNWPELPNPRGRMPILVADIGADGKMTLIKNQFHFIDEKDTQRIIQKIISSGKSSGVLREDGLRFLKADNGSRIAIADISVEQEMLGRLVINALFIGVITLLVFFGVSLILARWAVRPVAVAWERQRQFVADASHELKTPLTVILSNADMIVSSGTYTDDKQARRVGHIQAEAVRMKKLVEDLLLLAKSDSVENKPVLEQVDFGFVVKSAVLAYESVVFDEQKNLNCSIGDVRFISGNPQRLEQLVSILLDNAVKYCLDGGTIDVTLKESKGTLLLKVENDGEPIPENQLEHIFERFYRADASRSDSASFGLGLSIAQSIVVEHGGRIWAENRPDHKNSFFVTLPISR